MEPSLGGWWQALRSEGNSNLQLIGELFYLWGWEKIFGHVRDRVAGLEHSIFCRRRARARLGTGAATPPPNRRRPPRPNECFSLVLPERSAALSRSLLFRLAHRRLPFPSRPRVRRMFGIGTFWFRLFCIGIIGLCATSLIAVPWALGALGAVLYWNGLHSHHALRAAFQNIVHPPRRGSRRAWSLLSLDATTRSARLRCRPHRLGQCRVHLLRTTGTERTRSGAPGLANKRHRRTDAVLCLG